MSGLKKTKPHNEAGFTLFELLVVLAIMGLLVGVVGPPVIGIGGGLF